MINNIIKDEIIESKTVIFSTEISPRLLFYRVLHISTFKYFEQNIGTRYNVILYTF